MEILPGTRSPPRHMRRKGAGQNDRAEACRKAEGRHVLIWPCPSMHIGVITAESDWQNPESAAAAAWHLAQLGSKDKRITGLLLFSEQV